MVPPILQISFILYLNSVFADSAYFIELLKRLFPTLRSGVLALSLVLAEQEGENLSGLSNNPDKAIFAVRENGTTCLMVEFAVKFLVPYDVLALNGIDVRNSLTDIQILTGNAVLANVPDTHTERISRFKCFQGGGILTWIKVKYPLFLKLGRNI